MARRMTFNVIVPDDVDPGMIEFAIKHGYNACTSLPGDVLDVSFVPSNDNPIVATEAKVCPHCGSVQFTMTRNVDQRYIGNSEGEVVKILEEKWRGAKGNEHYEAARGLHMTCATCTHIVKRTDTVPEWFFHEVICDDNFDDTALIVISDREYEELTPILEAGVAEPGWDANAAINNWSATLNGGDYKVMAVVFNAEKPYVEFRVSRAEIIEGQRNPNYIEVYRMQADVLTGQFNIVFTAATPNGDEFTRNFRVVVISETQLANVSPEQYISDADGNDTGNEEEQ